MNDKVKCLFMFDFEDVRVILGVFEGIYVWMFVNFLEGNFILGKFYYIYGILDLGGVFY